MFAEAQNPSTRLFDTKEFSINSTTIDSQKQGSPVGAVAEL